MQRAPSAQATRLGASPSVAAWPRCGRAGGQHARPVGAQLLVLQGLRAASVLHPDKAVGALTVGPAGLVHLPGEPVPSVETKVHGEGKPGLHPDVTQAQFCVQEVVVEVITSAGLQHQVDVFGLAVAAPGVGGAVFRRAEEGDQAGSDAVLAGDLASEGLFANLAAGQIAEGAALKRAVSPSAKVPKSLIRMRQALRSASMTVGWKRWRNVPRKRSRSKPDKTPVMESPQRSRKAGGTPVPVGAVCEFITQTFAPTPGIPPLWLRLRRAMPWR